MSTRQSPDPKKAGGKRKAICLFVDTETYARIEAEAAAEYRSVSATALRYFDAGREALKAKP